MRDFVMRRGLGGPEEIDPGFFNARYCALNTRGLDVCCE